MDKEKVRVIMGGIVNLLSAAAAVYALLGKTEQAQQLQEISSTLPVTVEQVIGLVGILGATLSKPFVGLFGKK